MNFFSSEELDLIRQHPEIEIAKKDLQKKDTVSFHIQDERISEALREGGFPAPSHIPMRWITGDSKEHIDVGSEEFKNTFLIYVKGEGKFIVGQDTHSIYENSAFTFNEGVKHYTQDASTRLLLGPMNEYGNMVGAGFANISIFSNTDKINIQFTVNSSSDILKACSLTAGDFEEGKQGIMIEDWVNENEESFSQAVCSFTGLQSNTIYTYTLYNSYTVDSTPPVSYMVTFTDTIPFHLEGGEGASDNTVWWVIGIALLVLLYIVYSRK